MGVIISWSQLTSHVNPCTIIESSLSTREPVTHSPTSIGVPASARPRARTLQWTAFTPVQLWNPVPVA